jgi:predicted  nucleic acid-binding Zn-ribbon protein
MEWDVLWIACRSTCLQDGWPTTTDEAEKRMRVKRRLGWVAALVLSAGVLTGCGGGSTEDFCKSFEDVGAGSEGLSTTDSLDQIEELVDNAPDEIKEDVEAVNEEFEKVREAVEDTDVDLDTPADELSEEDEAALQEAAVSADIDQEKIDSASTNIDEWAKDNCDNVE